jgi:tRNA-2-methylthio-N6-dimethylallyladenosine synthase
MLKTLDILTPTEKEEIDTPIISIEEPKIGTKKLYIESYGCAMNFADSEVVSSIMRNQGFSTTSSFEDADVLLLNTCAIRENAEIKVRNRLKHFIPVKKKNPAVIIGILGCMAERLKTKLLEEEQIVDLVAGPDSYRDLPNLVFEAESGQKAVNVFLSREETYADISPVRLNSNGVSAYISIMRGCDNMCSFCVVPYTRGRERSREPQSIVNEAIDLVSKGYKEVTLLGQNVDSYKWQDDKLNTNSAPPSGVGGPISFANLLEKVAKVSPELRVRFSTSHPKDITDEVLYTIKKYENICNYVHLPAQSGSSRILDLMNRTYDRDWYLGKIARIREIIGEDCGISHDMITGFCTETEEDHQETLSLMEEVKFNFGYMFTYSERPGTPAAKKFTDDIPETTKQRRLTEIIDLQHKHSMAKNLEAVGKVHKVLIEGFSKKSDDFLFGRNDENKVIVFPKGNLQKGQYANILVTDCTLATLKGVEAP